MMKITLAVLALGVGAASACAEDATHLRGTIEATDRATVTIKRHAGGTVTVAIPDETRIFAATDGKLSDVKPESYIGAAAIPQPDGTQQALQVTVFASALRGTADGHYPWDLAAGSTLTNGAVGTLTGTSGRTVKVQYKGGEKTVVVPEDVPVTQVDPGDKSLLVAGARVVAIIRPESGGKREAAFLVVGRNGVVPSM